MAMTKSLSTKLYELLRSEFPNSSASLRSFALSKKYKELKNHYRIYRSADGYLHLGFIDGSGFFCGRDIINLACGDKDTYAYNLNDAQDVTQFFINEYSTKGMCAYTDMRHDWLEDHDDSHPDGVVRTCKYCGHTETLHSKMVRKVWWE